MSITPGVSDQPSPVVLVIDDEDYVADLIATALEMHGFIVHVAYNGRDGLSRAREVVPDLMIIDIMMPYINGEELALILREDAAIGKVPIILISAGARPRKAPANVVFLPKPFEIDQVIAVAHEQTA